MKGILTSLVLWAIVYSAHCANNWSTVPVLAVVTGLAAGCLAHLLGWDDKQV